MQYKKARRKPKIITKLAITPSQTSQNLEFEGFFNLSLPLVIIKPDGYFWRLNPAWLELLGYTRQELLARPQLDFVHPEDRAATQLALAKLSDGKTINLTNRYRCQDGTYRLLAWKIAFCLSTKLIYGSAQDISQQQETLTELTEIKQRYQLLTAGIKSGLWDENLQINNPKENQKIQDALQQSEQRYQSLVEATAQIIWHTNAKGEFLPQQPAWSAFTGQTEAEAAGWGWLNAIHPDEQTKTRLDWSTAVANYTVYQGEHRLRRYDGEYRNMSVRAVPVKEIDGIREWVGVHTDITKYKQAELALIKNGEMFCFLLEHTPAAIAMFNKEMQYQLVSRRFLENYQLDYADIMGKSHYEVFPQLPARWRQIHQRCLQGASELCNEDLFISPDGRNHWEKWEIRPWTNSNGEISGLILVTEIITEQKEIKEQLQQLNAKLLQSNRDLEQFAYVASHDLQEPLRAVTSYAQLFARKYQGNLDAQADKYLNYVVEGAIRMQQLIEDLLNFSRIGTHGNELQPMDLEVILSQVERNLKVAIDQSQAIIIHEPLPTVIGDKTQLVQLLQNLIANAIKFRKSEAPKVEIKTVQQGNKWLISLTDNGIGIEEEYFERIFIIFQRLHSRTEYPGTGIGLAVCQKIVERHGGKIWLESTFGVGTTFYLTMPICELNNHNY